MSPRPTPIIEDREPAPVVILPLTPTIDHDELILNVPDAEPDDEHAGAGAATGVVAGAAGAAAIAGSMPAAAADGGGAAVTSLAARGSAVGAQSALNRRLGNLALGGAAVASALVLALASAAPACRSEASAGPDVTGYQHAEPRNRQPPGTEGETAAARTAAAKEGEAAHRRSQPDGFPRHHARGRYDARAPGTPRRRRRRWRHRPR